MFTSKIVKFNIFKLIRIRCKGEYCKLDTL